MTTGAKKASRKKAAKRSAAKRPRKQKPGVPDQVELIDPEDPKSGKVYHLEIDTLAKMADPKNPRKPMRGRKFEALKALHRKFGPLQNVVVNTRTGFIVGGHQRVRAAMEVGFKTYPTVFVDRTPTEGLEVNIGLNQVTGQWDEDLLLDALGLINEDGLGEISLTGFDDAELAALLQTVGTGKTDDDATPDPGDVEKRCTAGDIWILGEHRLICGDATCPQTQAALFDGAAPVLCMTDPPYGVGYDPDWMNKSMAAGHNIKGGTTRLGGMDNDDRAGWGDVFSLSGCDVLYHWTASGQKSIESGVEICSAGYEIRNQIIWNKDSFAISRGHYHGQHESCWYAVRRARKAHWIGDRSNSTVWCVSHDKRSEGDHPTQKPVELFTRAIANHKGDVFEPFCGSGTCLIACEKLSRRCYAMEINPEYCDVILARWEAFTGLRAVKDGTGGENETS